MLLQMGSSSPNKGEHKKYLKFHHLAHEVRCVFFRTIPHLGLFLGFPITGNDRKMCKTSQLLYWIAYPGCQIHHILSTWRQKQYPAQVWHRDIPRNERSRFGVPRDVHIVFTQNLLSLVDSG